MFEGLEGLRIGRDQEAARVAAVAKAEGWTIGQAARLDTTPEAILEAIRRGPWLPAHIEVTESKYALEDDPPLCAEIIEAMERTRRAPIVHDHTAKHAA